MNFKHMVSALLSAVMAASAVLPLYAGAADLPRDGDAVLSEEGIVEDVDVRSTNSFGKLFSQELTEKQEEQLQGNGCTVFSVTMDGNTADVSFQTLYDATLVVGIYSEDKTQLLASGTAEVTADDESALVTVTGSILAYYYVKAYLIDPLGLSPLSTEYENPDHTQEMQEFFQKTAEDFPAERVLNLDDDPGNNFAVYQEDVIVLEPEEGADIVTSADDENAVYVIEHADETVLSLQPGDLLAYAYGEEDVLIVKVGAISVDGTTVTLTGDDTSMDEVFGFVRIEAQQGMEDAAITPEEGVDIIEEEESDSELLADEGVKFDPDEESGKGSGHTTKIEKKFIDWEPLKGETNDRNHTEPGVSGSVKINGSVAFTSSFFIKVHLAGKTKSVELNLNYELKVSLSIEGKVSVHVPLGSIGFSPVPGVYAEITPSVVLRLSASVEFDGTWKGGWTAKASYSKQDGKSVTSTMTKPKTTLSFKAEGSLFVGIDLRPAVKIIHDKLCSVSCTAEAGVEFVGKLEQSRQITGEDEDPYPESFHDCEWCIDGDMNFKFSIRFDVTFIKIVKLSLTLLDRSYKLRDWYYSIDNKEFDFGECPHELHRVRIHVQDENGEPVVGAVCALSSKHPVKTYDLNDPPTVTQVTTDGAGQLTLYMQTDHVTLRISGEGFRDSTAQLFYEYSLNDISYINYKKVVPVQGGSGAAIWEADYVVTMTHGEGSESPTEEAPTEEEPQLPTEDESIVASGKLGYSNLTWRIIDDVMTIEGTGEIPDFQYSSRPWTSYSFHSVIIKDGISNIGSHLFKDCSDLTSVTLPESVTSIDSYAFYGCKSITSINLPDSLTTIGHYAFYECSELSAITFSKNISYIGSHALGKTPWLTSRKEENPLVIVNRILVDGTSCEGDLIIPSDIVSISPYAFSYAWDITSVVIPDGISIIDSGTFAECRYMETVTIPESVTVIGENAFAKCYSLSNITLPSGLTEINSYAFDSCGITELFIPADVTSMGGIYYCPHLTSIQVAEDNPYYCSVDGVLYNKDRTKLISCPAGKEGEVNVEEGITNIPFMAFGNCKMLTSITLPESVTEIENYAFSNCSSLLSINIPNSVYYIGTQSFAGCQSLTSITIPGSCSSIAEGGFMNCTGLTTVIISEGFNTIGSYAFSGCSSLTSITLPSTIKYIFSDAFRGCSELNDVYYTGTEEQWDAISIDTYPNVPFESATIHYNSTGSTTSTQSLPRILAAGDGTADYTDLLPSTLYNFYLLRTQDTDAPLSPDNLLYLTQFVTDESGAASLAYAPIDGEAAALAVPARCRMDNVSVALDDLVYTGSPLHPAPTVTCAGVPLTEGVDYELLGDTEVTQTGAYLLTVSGLGDFSGEITTAYFVYADADYTLGDVNEDGAVNANDAARILMAAARIGAKRDSGLTDAQSLAANVNGDAAINAVDASIVLRYAAAIGAKRQVVLQDFIV